jgi:hypothetical protein
MKRELAGRATFGRNYKDVEISVAVARKGYPAAIG